MEKGTRVIDLFYLLNVNCFPQPLRVFQSEISPWNLFSRRLSARLSPRRKLWGVELDANHKLLDANAPSVKLNSTLGLSSVALLAPTKARNGD